MTTKAKLLITNDDGVQSPGIHHLARVCVNAGYEVVVVAPDYNASGAGTSLARQHDHKPLQISQPKLDGVKCKVFAVNCPPAMCVLLSQMGAFEFEPDVVVSGINNGLNTGRSVLFSGTVGATLAAQNIGLKGVALSVGMYNSKWQFEWAAKSSLDVIQAVVEGPDRCVVNISVPGISPDDLKGIKWGCLAPFNSVRNQVQRQTESEIELRYNKVDYTPSEDSDLGLTLDGYISLTALHGNSEVWSTSVKPDHDFDPNVKIPGVTAGDQLTPMRTFLS